MDEINVGDRRRWTVGSDTGSEHDVLEVADFAINTTAGRYWRPEYDGASEPVPAAPTFERGDVVIWANSPRTITECSPSGGYWLSCPGHDDALLSAEALTPTGHKVATINEGQWFAVWRDGDLVLARSREDAEASVGVSSSALTIATVRDGRIVEPYVDDDGVEHLVLSLSEPRS